jgi:RNA polymerase sigma-70 factor (ECF subfamily)
LANTTVSLHLEVGAGLSPALEDHELVAQLQAGIESAYETLLVRYQQPVYNLVWRLLGDPSETSDVVQEVFLKIFRNIHTFRGNSSLKTWVYRIAVNEAHNHRRWFSRHHGAEVGLAQEDTSRSYEEILPDPGRTPYDLTLDQETRALLEEALAKLNPKFRAAVVLRDIEDLSYEEIAQVLDLSMGTVKSRILRGREALRKILEGRLEPGPSLHWSPQPVE